MQIVDAQIHLWGSGLPSNMAHRQVTSFTAAESIAMMDEGDTIRFMAMLGDSFSDAQFLVTGVVGPKTNAHDPNEFLHIGYTKKLTASVAQEITGHAVRRCEHRIS